MKVEYGEQDDNLAIKFNLLSAIYKIRIKSIPRSSERLHITIYKKDFRTSANNHLNLRRWIGKAIYSSPVPHTVKIGV